MDYFNHKGLYFYSSKWTVNDGILAINLIHQNTSKTYVWDINKPGNEPKCFTHETTSSIVKINRRWLAVIDARSATVVWDLNNNQEPQITHTKVTTNIELVGDTLVASYSGVYVYDLNNPKSEPVFIYEKYYAIDGNYLFTRTKMMDKIKVRLLSDLNEQYTLATPYEECEIRALHDKKTVFILFWDCMRKWELVKSDDDNPIESDKMCIDGSSFNKPAIDGDYVIAYTDYLLQVYNKFTLELIYEKRLNEEILGVKNGMIITRTRNNEITLIPVDAHLFIQ
jgi:hypothetical protein